MEKNLTSGSVAKTLVLFSLPFLLSCFLQTLYGLADMFIIGQFCPTSATTAVAVGGQVMHMLTIVIVGLSMGSTVLIGRAVGSRDENLKNKAVGNTAVIFVALSVVLTIVLTILVGEIVRLVLTPADAVAGTTEYLFICFLGIPFVTAYNIISSVFRGMGDSKSPMYFVAVACVVNIVLDLIFIGALGMGPRGAALGTTIAQGVSVIISLTYVVKKRILPGFSRRFLAFDSRVASDIFKVGIPIAAQDGFIQVSFIVITIFANMRGLNDSAAVGIVEKLTGILFLVPSALLASVSAICSQNVGAGEHERARKTIFYAIEIACGIGLLFAIAFQFCSGYAVGLFSSDAEVIRLGDQYMRSYVWDCIFAAIHFCFSGYFCAYSKAGLSFLHNVISAFCVRIPLAYYFSKAFTETLYPMGCAAPAGSLVSIVICIIAYLYIKRKVIGKSND